MMGGVGNRVGYCDGVYGGNRVGYCDGVYGGNRVGYCDGRCLWWE